ncbi:hypothetical protein niasHT_037445 [Heterodera trifolii]|uniref:Ribosome biogenesis protein NOP53 n=1 Tax=Heterodera trifolii TaxID=157864 RepID=A0ABD2IEY7_9BILA
MPASKQRKFNVKKPRPLSKADKLRGRQNRLLAQSHPDFLEERRSKRKQYLDEGFEPTFFDDAAEEGEAQNGAALTTAAAGKKASSRRKRGTAEEQADALFRDIQGEHLDNLTTDEEEEEAEEMADEEEEEDVQQEGEEKRLGQDAEVDFDADHAELDEHDDDEEDDDDDAPPEEFSSVPQKQFGLEEEEDEDQTHEFEKDDEIVEQSSAASKRRKLSKKKRDAMKRVEKVADGKYRIEMGGAHFEVVALGSKSVGVGQCADGFPPLPPPLDRGNESLMTLRERLLQISTAKKRSKGYRMPTDKRPKLAKC